MKLLFCRLVLYGLLTNVAAIMIFGLQKDPLLPLASKLEEALLQHVSNVSGRRDVFECNKRNQFVSKY